MGLCSRGIIGILRYMFITPKAKLKALIFPYYESSKQHIAKDNCRVDYYRMYF